MSTLPETAAPVQRDNRRRKPRPKLGRVVRWVERPSLDSHGWGAVQIAVGREQPWTYLICSIPCHLGPLLVGYEMAPLMPDLAERGDTYHVVIDLSVQRADSCECAGFLRWGRCKHCDAIRALRQTPNNPWSVVDPPAMVRSRAIDPPPF